MQITFGRRGFGYRQEYSINGIKNSFHVLNYFNPHYNKGFKIRLI